MRPTRWKPLLFTGTTASRCHFDISYDYGGTSAPQNKWLDECVIVLQAGCSGVSSIVILFPFTSVACPYDTSHPHVQFVVFYSVSCDPREALCIAQSGPAASLKKTISLHTFHLFFKPVILKPHLIDHGVYRTSKQSSSQDLSVSRTLLLFHHYLDSLQIYIQNLY